MRGIEREGLNNPKDIGRYFYFQFFYVEPSGNFLFYEMLQPAMLLT